MRNERLRALLLGPGQTPDKLADAVQVDAKTVERWITKGRIPYRRHRFEVATFLGVDESYIWPDALGRNEVAVVSESEVVAVYPHRSEVPRDVWGHLFSQAEREIGVLVYAGLFLSEDAGIQKILKDKATAGARVRILLGSLTADVHRGRHTRSSALSCNCGSAAIDPRTRLPDRDTDSLLARRCRRWDVPSSTHILGAWRNIFGANDLRTARLTNVRYADK